MFAGTVDKFQGQEAPISIYAMGTSSPEDAPRGMEFLYSLNRLNVATSRAKCVAAVVMSPTLVRVACRTPAPDAAGQRPVPRRRGCRRPVRGGLVTAADGPSLVLFPYLDDADRTA